MKDEKEQKETIEIQETELETIAVNLPVRTRLRAGRVAACCNMPPPCCN